ncbi:MULTISPECIES: protein kinase [unclassified Paenibacillus]|uniref:serine/threonine protein kinase n=1 Tax=unclassified Paenibacillus TaxID=185978 RepID=UPI000895BFE3|nr:MULTISPECIES: protein kinase [unclassified Paenibacillus]OMC67196.1 serine/threonine protein kinase [Paenibacillus sp. FSL H7-0326]SDW66594.1 serine/threonine protein kinase [Paenibacillus sp. PDC88]
MRFFSFLSSFLSAWRDYPAEINTVLGDRYVNLQLLGEGSYGMTYKCLDQKSGAVVALKQSRPSKGEYAEHLLRREKNILQALGHPQIPELLDFFVEDKHTYLVMTYLEGDTLEDLIFEQGCIYDEASCIEMTLKLLDVVQYIHKKGYVHLDLRIPNVLFQEERLSVIDFGLARQIGEEPPLGYQRNRKGLITSKKMRKTRRPETAKPPKSARSANGAQFKLAEEQSDLADIGHFMLFMLYSTYESEDGADTERSWQEELSISSELQEVIERLLELKEPYSSTDEFYHDLHVLKQNHSSK